MNGGKTAAWMLALLVPAGFIAISKVQRDINVQLDAMHEEQDEVLIRSPMLMKVATLEYATLARTLFDLDIHTPTNGPSASAASPAD